MDESGPLVTIDPAWGHWFAGFLDGEGCFAVHKASKNGYRCTCQLTLRDDDMPILQEIQTVLGIGSVVHRPLRAKNPQWGNASQWQVGSKGDCLQLVQVLDGFPLRAKKKNDYSIWRLAVLAWQTKKSYSRGRFLPSFDDMAAYASALRVARGYRGDV